MLLTLSQDLKNIIFHQELTEEQRIVLIRLVSAIANIITYKKDIAEALRVNDANRLVWVNNSVLIQQNALYAAFRTAKILGMPMLILQEVRSLCQENNIGINKVSN